MRSLCILIACLVSASGASVETITIGRVVPYSDNSGAREEIKRKCMFDTQIPEQIAMAARGQLDIVITDEDLETIAGKVLIMEITEVIAPRGGGFVNSGQSAMVHFELREDGRIIASKDRRRNTMQGFSTCASLKRVSRALGMDIARWLQQSITEDRASEKADVR